MAPAAPTEPEENPYELLDLSQEATDAEIRTAYRTRSLKVHPDRVRLSCSVLLRSHSHSVTCRIETTLMQVSRLVPRVIRLIHVYMTAQKFHALTVASTLLLDPLRRLALDAQLRLAAAKKARFSAYDNKRKALVTELEERERAFKKSRLDQEKQKAAREGENDRIKEAGRRMREERERRLEELARTKDEEVGTEADEDGSDENAPPPLGPYDTTIRVKFTLSVFPTLDTAPALASHLKPFGEIDEGAVVLSIKPKKASKKKKSAERGADDNAQGDGEKVVNAVIPFSQIGSAFAVVSSGPTLKEQGMEVSWAGGSEPPILEWLRDRGELGGKLKQGTAPPDDVPGGNAQKESRTDEEQATTFSTFVRFALLVNTVCRMLTILV